MVGNRRISVSLVEAELEKPSMVRQARLRTECADHYPTLPVHMWTSADSLAQLVASFPASLTVEINGGRTLLESDFEFQGGCCHPELIGARTLRRCASHGGVAPPAACPGKMLPCGPEDR
jgi:hypothetical protein